mmetsp:Transcript_26717/g.69121  ORF Transcript_26717/g.69121 Transcript_26717/m.69121 type:complete len:551 (+) Transcript_26717:109-1761(+)
MRLSTFALACVAGEILDSRDLQRARTKRPRASWKGDCHEDMVKVLNGHLKQMFPKVKPCHEWSVEQLQALQGELYTSRHEGFDAVYQSGADRRVMQQGSMGEFEAQWAELNELAGNHTGRREMLRDGHCHEAVMWLVHHVPAADQQGWFARMHVPMLSPKRHTCAEDAGEEDLKLCAAYNNQVTCADCHSGAGIPFQDPTDDPPFPDDPTHPGWNRQRRCDQNYDPPCTACEGLGGPYWGDKMTDFQPTTCELVKNPEEVPEAERIAPHFPAKFIERQYGSDRLVRVQNAPKAGKHHFYSQIRSTMWYDVGDNTSTEKLRHDTFYDDLEYTWLDHGLVSEVHLETPEQRHGNNTGPMISLLHGLLGLGKYLGGCTCLADPVGVPVLGPNLIDGKYGAFTEGAVYLGRIKMGVEYLIDGSRQKRKEMVVDHYMKWFLHAWFDADPTSPTYKMPVRFYGPYSGFAVYASVNATTPPPEVWTDACVDNTWGTPDAKDCVGKKFGTDYQCMNVEKTDPAVCAPWAGSKTDEHVPREFVVGHYGSFMVPQEEMVV